MSESNGVVRIGRKGRKKFAFGDDGAPFEVDVVVAFQEWIDIDEQFREMSTDRTIADMSSYHRAAVDFASRLAFGVIQPRQYPEGAVGVPGSTISTGEALDFIARLREQYDEVAAFFQPKLRGEPDSPGTSGAELQFSEEAP